MEFLHMISLGSSSHIALNLLKHEKSAMGVYPCQATPSAWKEEYLLKVLASGN